MSGSRPPRLSVSMKLSAALRRWRSFKRTGLLRRAFLFRGCLSCPDLPVQVYSKETPRSDPFMPWVRLPAPLSLTKAVHHIKRVQQLGWHWVVFWTHPSDPSRTLGRTSRYDLVSSLVRR